MKKKNCKYCNGTGIIDIGGSQANGVPCNTENECELEKECPYKQKYGVHPEKCSYGCNSPDEK